MKEHSLRTILLVVAIYHLALGALMFFAPNAFYDTIGKFPPKNTHYIKDVATFYIPIGIVFFVSIRRRSWRTPILVFAALEYSIHALNHLIDVGKASTDFTGWFDFFSLALIALIFWALASVAWRVQPEESEATMGDMPDEGLHSGS
jgi:predicted membrane protein